MKNPFIVFIFLIFLSACDFSVEINTGKDREQDRNSFAKTLDDWHQAAANADFDAYFSWMDDDAVFVGTDASEVWNKKEFMEFSKPYFDQGKAWSFKKINRNIYWDESHPKIAWFDETLDTWMGVCRGSGVLVKINNKWLIKHYVLSMTIPNDKVKEVMRVLKMPNSN